MADTFYPFTGEITSEEITQPTTPARIAVYDNMAMTPRVVTIEPSDITTYLEEITQTVYNLVIEQGATWPFMLIREIVENFIHASFRELTISIFDKGKTLTFCDGGPGISNKKDVMRPGFSSATKAMKKYIRGVGAGLPIVAEQMNLMNGVIRIEDNIDHGTVITISINETEEKKETEADSTIKEAETVAVAPNQPQQFAFQYPMMPPVSYPAGTVAVAPQYYQAATPQQVPAYPYPYPQVVPSYPAAQVVQVPPAQPLQPKNEEQTINIAERHSRHVEEPLDDLDEELVDLLLLFASHEKVGGKEVSERLGCSAPTSSRRLKELARLGYITKNRQKYVLTEAGLSKLGLFVQD